MSSELTIAEIEAMRPFIPQQFWCERDGFDIFVSLNSVSATWTWGVYQEGVLVDRGVAADAHVAKTKALWAAERYRETGVVNV